ncbi:MAG: tripartite tricarboxylate transporter TctB family protein [Butyricicoccus sp.]
MNTEKQEMEAIKRREQQINFWGSFALSIFAVVYLFFAFKIENISTAKWYDSPSLFPIVIGSCLLIFCLIYLWQNRAGFTISKADIENVKVYLKSKQFFRLMISIVTLAVYVFVLLGLRIGSFQLPYEAATFIYLFATMLFFRPKGFAIWKIVLISAVLSIAIGYGFSNLAKIPLP